jgi:2-dehydropantoate 2-reductase
MKEPEPVLILGTGAMACLFAARLAAAGVPVSMCGTWLEGLEALRREGVTLTEGNDTQINQPVNVIRYGEPCPEFHHALVLVKSWQTQEAAGQLKQCLAKKGISLTLQNGLGNRETLSQVLGAQRVALGVITAGANLLKPGQVQAAGKGMIFLGVHSRLAFLAGALQAAGFQVESVEDPDSLLWGKLVINAAINPLTALLGVTNGELLVRPTARALMVTLAKETAAVAGGLGIPLPYPDAVEAVESVAEKTALNHSSMLRDIQRQAPTEIDAICGAIVRAGEQAGVLTPLNQVMWQLIKALTINKN